MIVTVQNYRDWSEQRPRSPLGIGASRDSYLADLRSCAVAYWEFCGVMPRLRDTDGKVIDVYPVRAFAEGATV